MNFDNKTPTVFKGVYSSTVWLFVKGRKCAHGPNIRVPWQLLLLQITSASISYLVFVITDLFPLVRSGGWICKRPWILFVYRSELGLDLSFVVTCNQSWVLCYVRSWLLGDAEFATENLILAKIWILWTRALSEIRLYLTDKMRGRFRQSVIAF
jgi:hypothetical protein